jgi:hypothetical protein
MKTTKIKSILLGLVLCASTAMAVPSRAPDEALTNAEAAAFLREVADRALRVPVVQEADRSGRPHISHARARALKHANPSHLTRVKFRRQVPHGPRRGRRGH